MPGQEGGGGEPGQEQEQGGDPNDPMAGLPEEDLSQGAGGGESSGKKHIADPKRSLAAKMAWARRAHQTSESLEPGDDEPLVWRNVPGDILAGVI